jgi:hypothetical protein
MELTKEQKEALNEMRPNDGSLEKINAKFRTVGSWEKFSPSHNIGVLGYVNE